MGVQARGDNLGQLEEKKEKILKQWREKLNIMLLYPVNKAQGNRSAINLKSFPQTTNFEEGGGRALIKNPTQATLISALHARSKNNFT